MIVYEPRPYQKKTLDILHHQIQKQDILLLQAATGAGKTFMIVRLLQRYYFDHGERNFLILMHKKELIMQFIDAFNKFTDIDPDDIAICCSGITKKCDLEAPIVIGSVQTFINKINQYEGADLVVVDETHRAGYEGNESQYQKILETLRVYKPHHKTIGVTATAYRLNHGYIYGKGCRPGRTNFFPDLTHRITYKELVRDKFLMPLKGYTAVTDTLTAEISQIKTSGGEYIMSEAGDVMERHVESAVDAYERYGASHKSIAVFACTIHHAELLNKAFIDRGYKSVIIHSKLSKEVRERNLELWHTGKAQFAVSINILVEGFDMPALSCMIMCRPTKSPVVFIQSIGRILRMHEGKEEALLIDTTGNVAEFGLDLDNPNFTLPKTVEGEGGEAPEKICPGVHEDGQFCGERLHTAVLICSFCGFKFEKEIVNKELGVMEEVEFKQAQKPRWYDISSMNVFVHETNSGKKLLRAKLETTTPSKGFYNKQVSIWFCFEDYYSGYALEAGEEKWEQFSSEMYPRSVEEAEFLIQTMAQPTRVFCTEDANGYLEVTELDFEQANEQKIIEEINKMDDIEVIRNIPEEDVPF